MNNKLFSIALIASLFVGYSLSAFSQVKPEQLVRERQAAMILQGQYFNGQLNRMARGRIPYDANMATRYATFLDALSKMAWDGFDLSTKGVKSGTLPVVFTESAKFKQAQDRLEGEVAKLVAVTKSGGEAAVKAQITAVGRACSNCHDTFRESQ